MHTFSHSLRSRRAAPLLVLLGFVVFPFEWLGEHWHALGDLIVRAFPTDAQHAVGHATLFALLGGLALATFPALRGRPWRYALLALAGVAQEGLQLMGKGRGLVFDDGRDLAVDIVGLAIGWGLFWLAQRARRSRAFRGEERVG